MEVLGCLDEFNSLLGLIRCRQTNQKFKDILKNIQENLFIIQAGVGKVAFNHKLKVPVFNKAETGKTEKLIDLFEKLLAPGKGFVISGENEISAWLDYARAVARKTERSVLKLKKLNPDIFAYLNRLSGLLYVMARVAAKKKNTKESQPAYSL
ncbi:MAG: ATP/cobalamin adenosyltransferase [Parcubacteria group bacterium Athens0714_26]|nr:MAG: ATP/cobalamin adenosyltransferase [Parcubacteria group bacterium Athens1014_26]TSD03585.1 MAG: ATP/cobalamin adenosyltransferase [Parcubacteria group bacterium Athens0714_26]